MKYPKAPSLKRGSNPLAWVSLFDSTVDGERRVHCQRYDNCLSFAAANNWTSWSCRGCTVNEKISMDEWKYDLEGLARLIRAIVG